MRTSVFIIRQTKCLRIFETKRPDENTKRPQKVRFVLYINVVRIALEQGFLRLLLVMARRPFFLLAAAGCRGAARVLAPEDNSAVPPCAAVGRVRRRLRETSPARSGQLQRLHLQLPGIQWRRRIEGAECFEGFIDCCRIEDIARFPRLRVPARAVSRPSGRCPGGVCRRALPQSARKIRGHSAGGLTNDAAVPQPDGNQSFAAEDTGMAQWMMTSAFTMSLGTLNMKVVDCAVPPALIFTPGVSEKVVV